MAHAFGGEPAICCGSIASHLFLAYSSLAQMPSDLARLRGLRLNRDSPYNSRLRNLEY